MLSDRGGKSFGNRPRKVRPQIAIHQVWFFKERRLFQTLHEVDLRVCRDHRQLRPAKTRVARAPLAKDLIRRKSPLVTAKRPALLHRLYVIAKGGEMGAASHLFKRQEQGLVAIVAQN